MATRSESLCRPPTATGSARFTSSRWARPCGFGRWPSALTSTRARVTQAIAWRSEPRNSATAAAGVLSANRREECDPAHGRVPVGVLELARAPLPQEVPPAHAEIATRGAVEDAALLGGAQAANPRGSAHRRLRLSLGTLPHPCDRLQEPPDAAIYEHRSTRASVRGSTSAPA